MNDGYYTREELLEFGFAKLGEDVMISRKASIYGAKNMEIGSHVRIDDFCLLVGTIRLGDYIHIAAYTGLHASMGSITVGDFCGISSHVTFYAASDDYSGKTMMNAVIPEKYKHTEYIDMKIGRHTLIGAGVTLIPNAQVGEGVSIGAMSLVNSTLEPWSLYAGVPCRKLRDKDRTALVLEQEFLAEVAGNEEKA